jgi:multidrug efflux pump subunit AcrB
MNISAPFIKRPIGTTLLTVALLLSGILARRFAAGSRAGN